MTLLDTQIHVGRETTYGTPVAPTRSFEGMKDDFQYKLDYIESNGFRSGIQALISTRRTGVLNGAAGQLELDVMNKGFGMLFRAMTGSSVIVQQGSTSAYLQTHLTTANGPQGEMLTVQLGRPRNDGSTTTPYTYEGGKVTSFELKQSVGENAKLAIDFDFEDMNTSSSLASAAYVTSPTIYNWANLAVTVSGTSVDVKEISLKVDNQLDTERRFLNGAAQKKEPLRKAVPTIEGSFSLEFTNTTQRDLFQNQTVVPVVLTWTDGAITATINNYLKVTLAACMFNGSDPQGSNSELTSMTAPFTVLYDLTNPAVKIEYMSADTAF